MSPMTESMSSEPVPRTDIQDMEVNNEWQQGRVISTNFVSFFDMAMPSDTHTNYELSVIKLILSKVD